MSLVLQYIGVIPSFILDVQQVTELFFTQKQWREMAQINPNAVKKIISLSFKRVISKCEHVVK